MDPAAGCPQRDLDMSLGRPDRVIASKHRGRNADGSQQECCLVRKDLSISSKIDQSGSHGY
jgi:hypothetical protein